jgi:hypothetical protein
VEENRSLIHEGAEGSHLTLAFDGALWSEQCGVNLAVNTTSIQLQKYYNKAINYTLMVTCISFLQVSNETLNPKTLKP